LVKYSIFLECAISINVLFDKIIKIAQPSERAENPNCGH